MSYDMHAHRKEVRDWCLHLAAAPGWWDYAEDKARTLEKDDPTLHAGLTQAVRKLKPARTAGTTRSRQ